MTVTAPRPVDDAHRRRPVNGHRVPPHNLEAEQSLLGAMLLSGEAVLSAVEARLTPDDFYRPAHGHVFDAIMSIYGQGQPADPVTVAEQLHRAGFLEAVGGPAGLVALQANTPAIGNAARYAAIVEDHALLRSLIGVAGGIAEECYAVPDDVAAALDAAEAQVFAISARRVTDSLSPLAELVGPQLDRIEERAERGGAVTGLSTGLIDVDEKLCGLQPGNFVVVGGRPGAGKTSFALNIAAHVGLHERVPALVFSLEMSKAEITERLMSAEARVDSTRIRSGHLRDTDWPKLSGAGGRLAGAPIHVDDNGGLTVTEVRAKARRLKSRHGLGLVVVDYLQLMTGRRSAENRQVEVSEISRGLKLLARELEVPVVALSQLSRSSENRADKRPVLADLRESGSLEQDADVVLLIHRPELYDANTAERGTAEVNVAKQRNGPTGVIKLAYLEPYTRFASMARGAA